jgi:hypothetical protein
MCKKVLPSSYSLEHAPSEEVARYTDFFAVGKQVDGWSKLFFAVRGNTGSIIEGDSSCFFIARS